MSNKISIFGKKKKAPKQIGQYTEEDYKNAIEELDEEVSDDFFGKYTFSESASSVIAVLKAIIYICFVIIVSGALAYFAVTAANDVFAFVKSDEPTDVTIPEYVTTDELADILSEAKVIDYPWLFRFYAKLKHIDTNPIYTFVAGTYTVNPMMNYDELFIAFIAKNTITTTRVTIPEGYTVDEIITLFTSQGLGTREGWVDAINNYDFSKYEYLSDIDMSGGRYYRLEGYLFPDTYDFYTGQSEDYYLRKMLVRFDEMMNEGLRERCRELGITIDDALTIASIIEKEAYYANDYEQVASVIWNRLKNPSAFPKLECDSTIIYAQSHAAGERVTKPDLSYESPYNSYKYDGLTPGPVCNPSYDAMICALYPADTAYYYFVSDSENTMYYGKTLDEHRKNIEAIAKAEEVH